MYERITADSVCAKALRVILAFTLVFWSTFQVEALAYAALVADDGSAHEPGTLSNLEIWEVDKNDAKRVSTRLRDVRDTASEKKQDVAVELQVDGSLQLVAVPAWIAAPTPGDESSNGASPSGESPSGDSPGGETPGAPGDGSGDSAGEGGTAGDEDPGGETPGGESGGTGGDETGGEGGGTGGDETGGASEGGTDDGIPADGASEGGSEGGAGAIEPSAGGEAGAQFVMTQSDNGSFLIPKAYADDGLAVQADEPEEPEVQVADFVEWKTSDETIATVKPAKDGKGLFTLTAHKAGTVAVTCSLKADFASLPAATFAEEFPGKPFVATFEVVVSEKAVAAPYVQSIDIFKPGSSDVSPLKDNEEVVLTDKERESYSVRVRVNTTDPSLDDEQQRLVPYDFTVPKNLKETSGGKFDDLKWEVLNPDGTQAGADVATVENGVITLKGDGPVTVRCTSEQGKDGASYSTRFVVRSNAAPDVQGVSNPQNELTVIIDVPEVKSEIDDGQAAGSSERSAGASGSGGASDSSAPNSDGGISTQADEGADAAGSEEDAADSKEEGADSEEDAADSGSSASAAKTLKSTSKTYDYEKGDLEPFTIKYADDKVDEYRMSSPSGELVVKGAGPTLAALIYDAADPDGSLGLGPNASAGQTPLDIESVEFVIAGGRSVTVPWTDLVAASAPNNVILATESLVVEDEAGGLSTQADGNEGAAGANGADGGDATDADAGNANAGGATGAGSTAVANEDPDAGAVGDGTSGSGAGAGTSGSNGGATGASGSGATAGTSADGSSSTSGLLPNTRFRLLYNGGAGALSDPDEFRYINRVVAHVRGQVAEPEPVDTGAYIAYTPARKDDVAYLVPQFTLPDAQNGGAVQFHYEWQYAPDGSERVWSTELPGTTDKDRGQQLEVRTNDTSIGTWRRFILYVTLVDGVTGDEIAQAPIESRPVQIEEGHGFRVKLDYVPPIAGDVANFTAIPDIDPEDDEKIDESQIYYEWQMSTDYGQTWIGEGDPQWPDLLKQQSGVQSTTLRVPTKKIEEKKSASSEGEDGSDSSASSSGSSDSDASDGSADSDGSGSNGGSNSNATQLTWIRVVAHYNGKKTPSEPVPLTVHVGDTSGGKKDEIQEALDKGGETDDEQSEENEPEQNDSGSGNAGSPSPAPSRSRTQISELDRIVFEEPAPVDVGTQPEPTPAPSQSQPQEAPTQIYVNNAVTEQIADQQETQAKPGTRWTELSSINPTDEDVRNILAVNPFAPFAAPAALGITAAGALEKLLGFRRQTR